MYIAALFVAGIYYASLWCLMNACTFKSYKSVFYHHGYGRVGLYKNADASRRSQHNIFGQRFGAVFSKRPAADICSWQIYRHVVFIDPHISTQRVKSCPAGLSSPTGRVVVFASSYNLVNELSDDSRFRKSVGSALKEREISFMMESSQRVSPPCFHIALYMTGFQ
ncbi:uncharacterized protein BT62DRAFT_1012193 [Guyanagaster necrorhizus]|uniref:Uncharacterized protein n=1 Tax=Guyanagaster necrorhizus TaxID=856835 RepID=A0A9P7VI29_9AGAR|nr:uncharacterized protein BT62DRAFT_1012193 [Guyanagaster necrorhizus MCA 3950]KAG7440978.1 hypothetical protein BT62DRAFT_1012193 [Guyanagaster necrorhizus MCA 3950]